MWFHISKSVVFVTVAVIANTAWAAKMPGECRKIDIKESQMAIDSLLDDNADVRAATFAKVLAAPGSYTPPVFFAMVHDALARRKLDEAFLHFWFGNIRLRRDFGVTSDMLAVAGSVRKLKDDVGTVVFKAVANGIAAGEGFPEVGGLSATDVRRLGLEASERDAKYPVDYDRRWVAWHGSYCQAGQAVMPGKHLLTDQAEHGSADAAARKSQAEQLDAIVSELDALARKRANEVAPPATPP